MNAAMHPKDGGAVLAPARGRIQTQLGVIDFVGPPSLMCRYVTLTAAKGRIGQTDRSSAFQDSINEDCDGTPRWT